MMTRLEMQTRRLQAAGEFQAGLKQTQIASHFAVSRTTASRWAVRLRQGGVDGMLLSHSPGRPCRLTPVQLLELAAIYRQGPEKGGYPKWTCENFAAVIREKYGLRYDIDHVGRILHKIGVRDRGRKAKGAAE